MKIKYLPVLLIALILPLPVSGQSETYSIKKTRLSSNSSDEFSPVYYQNGLVFCSNMTRSLVRNYLTPDDKGLLNIVFADTATWKSRIFSNSLRTIFNDGPASFSRNGDTVYFSRNIRTDVDRDDVSPRNKLGIFSAVLENGNWGKILDFRFNNEYYNITTPFISPDGKRLFFAADNPEGMGGLDLYYCDWKVDYWDDPVNLGPEVNTKGNESYPSVNSEGGVFFSSDGHPGLGGKDLFYTRQSGDKWLPPAHLDAPVNSKSDDFSLIADPVMNRGYFSSNREGTVDIFQFRTNVRQLFYCDKQRINQYCFKFTDKDKIPVDSRYLQLVWDFGDGTTAQGLNAEHCFKGPGLYQVRLDATDKKTGRVVFTKLSFDLDLRDIEQPVILAPASAMAGAPVTLDGMTSSFAGSSILSYTWHFGDRKFSREGTTQHMYRDKGDYDIRLGLVVRNDKTGMIREVCSVKPIKVFSSTAEKDAFDMKGAEPAPVVDIFDYDQAVTSNVYSAENQLNEFIAYRLEVLRSKTKLEKTTDEAFRRLPDKYILRENFLSNENVYSYTIAEEHSLMATYPAYSEISNLGFTDAKVYPVVVEDPSERELNNLERVFGVSTDLLFVRNTQTLSSAGTQLLDLVLGFMAKYPAIRLQVACHTDNTGSAPANLTLSGKRAEAMVNYLVVNGVSRNRLVPRGYGGIRPIAPNYQESDRKNNRRVDFIIL